MNKAAEPGFDFDAHSRTMALAKARCATLAKDLFLVAMIDVSGWLAVMHKQQADELGRVRRMLDSEQFVRTQ